MSLANVQVRVYIDSGNDSIEVVVNGYVHELGQEDMYVGAVAAEAAKQAAAALKARR